MSVIIQQKTEYFENPSFYLLRCKKNTFNIVAGYEKSIPGELLDGIITWCISYPSCAYKRTVFYYYDFKNPFRSGKCPYYGVKIGLC